MADRNQEDIIQKYLLETEEDNDIFESRSDDSESDQVSASDHNTNTDADTEADDTDEDPDFDPTAETNPDSDFDYDVIPPSDDEQTRSHVSTMFTPLVSAIQPTTSSQNKTSMEKSDRINQVIEEVVRGSGNSEYISGMDVDVIEPIMETPTNLDLVIEEVVKGTGSLENVLVGKDGLKVWKRNPIIAATARARPANIIRRLPGPKNAAKHTKTPLDCFNLMIDDEIIEIIVYNTNLYIENKSGTFSRERDGRQTNKIEMKAFLGLLILAGAMRSGHQNLQEMWARDGFGIEVFYCTMSLRRFYFLLQSIRFDNIIDRPARRTLDKLAAFRNVFEKFNHNCAEFYVPCAFITIDEQLVPFRGRCPFRQFMKSKPAKYGLKIFTITDAKMFYVHKMEIYVGNQPENSPYSQSNKPKDVVMRLVRHLEHTSRNITADNWFTSIGLVNELSEKGLTYVGTVRKDKTELPPELVCKERIPNTSIFGFDDNMTIVSYSPKRNRSVVLVSSMHFDAAIDNDTGDMKKPEIITFYNSTKSGVDVVDEKCGTYSTSRRCLRWPLVLFYRLLDIAGINAQVIYLSNCEQGKVLKRRTFLRQIGFDLVKHNVAQRASITSLPRTLRSTISQVAAVQDTPQEAPRINPRPGGSQQRCVICPRKKDAKTKQKCTKCQRPMCSSHMDMFCKTCQSISQATSSDSDE